MVERVAAILDTSAAPAVIDPVMIAKGGAALLADDAVAAVRTLMVPRAALLTPNAPEAEALTGLPVHTTDDLRRAGEVLLGWGAKAVLMKGGHISGERLTDVLMTPDGETLFDRNRRIHDFRKCCVDNNVVHVVRPVENKEKFAEVFFRDHFQFHLASLHTLLLSQSIEP
jgi:hydroxymethylpyrimidine kinase/phosphomethylpyrimidine kinase